MNKNIRAIVVDKIVKLIPPHIKPVDYISDFLDISKEAAYRRLSGKMSFDFEELIDLAEKLGFSLDELVAQKDDNTKIVIDLKIESDPEKVFLEKFERYKQDVDNRLLDENSSAMMAFNFLPSESCVHYENLFKFAYYVWFNWKDKGLPKPKFSEIEISPKLEDLRKYIDAKVKKIPKNTLILDANVFLGPLKLVHYFYNLGLIEDNEKKVIKEDFRRMIDAIEKMVRTDYLNLDTRNIFYLSNFNIGANNGYYLWNGNASSSFSLSYFNRIIISKPEVCEAHKEWFLSLKKYSTLITGSNEIAQAEYFKKQREYVNQL